MTAASQSESAPLVEMMLESARREAEAGAYDYAIEYVLAVIAVEPKLVVPRLQLQELALSLLSSPQLHESYINPVRANVLSTRVWANRELIIAGFGVDELESNLLDAQESRLLLALARNLTGTSVPSNEIEACAEAITLKTVRLLQSVGISDAVAQLVGGNTTPALEKNRSRLIVSYRRYSALAACITFMVAVGTWLYLPVSRDRAASVPPPDVTASADPRPADCHGHTDRRAPTSGSQRHGLIFPARLVIKAGGSVKYASPQAAFEQGLGAYKYGYYEIAIPALEEAATKGAKLNRFFAEFYLACIYSDNASAVTDHAKAYLLFQKLADDNADADPDDGQRAPFVAKALTALAGYLRRGVKEIGVAPDPGRAVDYLHHAATFFRDKDAQFELAKVYLGGVGTPEDVKRGMHYLSVLTEEGYPGAQAFLADLLWRGRYVKKDERRALALIRMAVENAPEHERIWIEDIYQNIFCSTSHDTRKQADGIVAVWRKMFARPTAPADRMGLGVGLQPQRACGNGELVDINRAGGRPAKDATPAVAMPPAARPDAAQGSNSGFGFRDAGAPERAR